MEVNGSSKFQSSIKPQILINKAADQTAVFRKVYVNRYLIIFIVTHLTVHFSKLFDEQTNRLAHPHPRLTSPNFDVALISFYFSSLYLGHVQ